MTTLGAQIISDKPEKMKGTILWLKGLNIFDQVCAVADIDKGMDIVESAKLADKYTTQMFEHQEQAIDTAISICDADWQFRIDDDERMGVNFLRDVCELIKLDVDVFWFNRMWLYPDDKHFIVSLPWYPDAQPRLWRKGFLKATPGVHMHPTTKGKNVTIERINIFHYVLIDNTYEERIERCKMQAAFLNQTLDQYRKGGMAGYYLPEDYINQVEIRPILEEHIIV